MFNASRLMVRRAMAQPWLIPTRHVKIQKVCKKPEYKDFFEHNRSIGRHLSPSLSIYKVQLTSLLSFSHRLTGVTVSAYVIVFGLLAWVLPNKFEYYISYAEDLYDKHGVGDIGITALKFIAALPYSYHLGNGIRHLIWDSGYFMTIPGVYSTGYAMVVAVLALNTGIALLTFDRC